MKIIFKSKFFYLRILYTGKAFFRDYTEGCRFFSVPIHEWMAQEIIVLFRLDK